MEIKHQADDAQAALWSGVAGQAWVEAQVLLDVMFKPLEDLLAEAASALPARRLLDVGCGAGATTLAVARRLGAQGACTGIDISAPMIAAARGRAERENAPASFIHADAQAHMFAPASYDTIISRFGVMFFDDPVQAFANLRRAATHGAALRCIAWRSPGDNPFMTTAERAAAPLLPGLPARQPDMPGQFAFADPARIRGILARGGWERIDIQPLDAACAFPETELVRYLSRLGPLGRVLHTLQAPARQRIIDTVRAAFEPFVHGAEVRFNAACWMVSAEAQAARQEASHA